MSENKGPYNWKKDKKTLKSLKKSDPPPTGKNVIPLNPVKKSRFRKG